MDRKSQKPLRLLLNPLTIWTDLALKTGQAMWASAHAAAARSTTPTKVAVIPPVETPAPNAQVAKPAQKTLVRQASKAARSKAPRPKLRSKASAKRRAKR